MRRQIGSRRPWRAIWASVVGTALALGASPALAQSGALGVAIVPVFSSPAVAGEDDAPAQLQFTNFSSGATASQTVTMSALVVNPSCATAVPDAAGSSPCSTPEQRPNPLAPILHLGQTSAAGTTCPGGPFLISGPDSDGDYTFTPTAGPVTLAPVGQPGSSCAIVFTFDAVQRPGDGATAVVAVARATSASFPGGVPSTGAASVTVNPALDRYTALSPVRIEDTRVGAGGLSGPVGPGATVEVQIAGRAGVPAGAKAVVMNVTLTQPTGEGFLTLFPSGTPRPLAANLNFTPGKTVPNLVVVKLGSDGRVGLFNSSGSTHVIFDVAGYFGGGTAGNTGRYQALVPARIVDTRLGAGGVRVGPGQSIDVQVSGRGGAPATGVSAAVLNVVATGTTAESYLTVYPTGEPRPLAANLNFVPGDTVANRTMTKLGTGGRVTIYNNAGGTDVVVDIGGTYTDATVAGTSGGFVTLAPSRILDTRAGAAVPAGGTIEVPVAGQGGAPATGATAVVLNVAVTQPAGPGHLTIFPAGTARPLASDLNYASAETRPNLVVVRLGADGKVALFASTQAHVVVDVAGYFT